MHVFLTLMNFLSMHVFQFKRPIYNQQESSHRPSKILTIIHITSNIKINCQACHKYFPKVLCTNRYVPVDNDIHTTPIVTHISPFRQYRLKKEILQKRKCELIDN